jgi:hypothetical protein
MGWFLLLIVVLNGGDPNILLSFISNLSLITSLELGTLTSLIFDIF